MRSLDRKLANIRGGKYTPDDFIIADAKDGDIGFGRASCVRDAKGHFTPRATHLEAIREMTKSGLVDIMLMSASTAERLSNEGLFKGSEVTPAIRLNDTTDIWSARGGRYKEEPSRHHRTARIDQAQEDHRSRPLLGHLLEPARHRRAERRSLFRVPRRGGRATACGTSSKSSTRRSTSGLPTSADIGSFINDNIVRTLAGVMEARLSEVSETSVQRPARHGGACLLRSRSPDRRAFSAARPAPPATHSSC